MDDTFQMDESSSSQHRGGRNIFQIFWQRRGLLLFGLAMGITLGLLGYSQRTPIYRATAQALIVKQQGASAIPMTGSDPRVSVMEDYVATHLIVIRSPYVISMAVEKFKLGNLRSLQGKDPVGTILAGLRAERETSKDGPGGSSNNVINLAYSSTDPNDAQEILVAIIRSYQKFLDDTYQNTSEKIVKSFNEMADDVREKLKKCEKDYQDWLGKEGAPPVIPTGDGVPLQESLILNYQKKEIEFHEQVKALEERLRAIDEAMERDEPREIILAIGERRYEKGTLNQLQAKKESATALETALFKLSQEETDLKHLYGDDHPELIRVREKIKSTKDFYKKIEEITRQGDLGPTSSDPVEAMVLTLKGELAHNKLMQGYFTHRLKEAIEDAKKYSAWYSQDRARRTEMERLGNLQQQAFKQLDVVSVGKSNGGFIARVLAEPGAGMKTSPVFWQFVFLGAILGLLVSSGGAYLLDLADKSFRSPEEIRRRLGYSIIGHVPYMSTSPEPVKTLDAAGNVVELDAALVALHTPVSPVSEGFRGIRTAIYFSTKAQRHKVIQVTSPNMGDGKTTTITNLAIAIAQSGRKVLLVDADLRRPRVHRAFGLTSKIGLAEVISGTAELDEAIQVTVVPNLSVLPCGRRPQNPSELLTSPKFEDVIDDLRDAFDYVLIDTPPLLAVSDPCIVAARVDGLILTVRISKNGRPSAERAADLLADVEVNCLGIVVNGVGKHGSISGYGYEHYKYTDEYASHYTTTDDQAIEDDADRMAQEIEEETPDRRKIMGNEEPQPAPTIVGQPSTNGHSDRALSRE